MSGPPHTRLARQTALVTWSRAEVRGLFPLPSGVEYCAVRHGIHLRFGRPAGERSSLGQQRLETTPALRRCEKITRPCHSERSEESAFVGAQRDKCRFFASLRMTDNFFTASSAGNETGDDRQAREEHEDDCCASPATQTVMPGPIAGVRARLAFSACAMPKAEDRWQGGSL